MTSDPHRTGGKRVFFALWPDNDVTDGLYRQVKRLHKICGGRSMHIDTLHMTLFFVGEVRHEQISALIDAANGISGDVFSMDVDTIQRWQHNRIVFAGVSRPPDQLLTLQSTLSERLLASGVSPGRQLFKPHVTLLRNTSCLPAADGMQTIPWHVREFVLIESMPGAERVRYRKIKGWPLHGNEVIRG